MVRIDSKAKFTPNGEELKKIREILNLPKSKMGDFFKSYGVKKLGDRVYISIENGQKTEMKKIYDIAYAFNKEFKKRNLDNKTTPQELLMSGEYISTSEEKDQKKIDNNQNSKEGSVILTHIMNAENLFNKLSEFHNRKKVFNIGAMPPGASQYIKGLFSLIEEYNKEKFKFKFRDEEDESFSIETKTLDMSEEINKSLNYLYNEFNIKLFMGKMDFFLADASPAWDENEKDIEDTYELSLTMSDYIFYYFTNFNADSVTAIHKRQYSENELSDIIFKHNIKLEIKKSNDTDWKSFFIEVRRELIDKLNNINRKKDENSNYHFFQDRIHDEDVKFILNDRYDSDIEF